MQRAEFEETIVRAMAAEVPTGGALVFLLGWNKAGQKDGSDLFSWRIKSFEVEDGPEPPPSASEEAIRALVNLGYGRSEADDAVRSAVTSNGSAETSDVIRTALQLLAKGK